MPTVSFNIGYANYLSNFQYDGSGGPSTAFFKFGRHCIIYTAGTSPDTDVVDTWNGIDAYNGGAGQLVKWSGIVEMQHNKVSNTQFQFNSQLKPAIASGVAAEFLFWGDDGNPANAGWGFKGTVGLPGSGADMEIGNVNIVGGENYQIGAWAYNIFQEFTY